MEHDVDKIRDVSIVGGGDSGLIAALSLESENPDLDIRVIDDFDRKPPEVGKASFSALLDILHNELNVNLKRFHKEVKPVWKLSAHYINWSDSEFDYTFDTGTIEFGNGNEKLSTTYRFYKRDYYPTLAQEIISDGRVPLKKASENKYHLYRPVAYHLNLGRFNEFLRKLCRERNIELINDEIKTVECDENRIKFIEGRKKYESDLYVDSTGFSKILANEQNRKFIEFDFPVDSAVFAKKNIEKGDIEHFTSFKLGESGWFWQIDTYENRDLGYVYSSGRITEKQAKDQLKNEANLGDDEDIKSISWDSGHLERPWLANCLAIGNSQGFVEPLQATNLTTSAILSVEISKALSESQCLVTQETKKGINKECRLYWDSIYSFLLLHYNLAEGVSEFWRSFDNKNERLADVKDIYEQYGFAKIRLGRQKMELYPEEMKIFPLFDYLYLMREFNIDSGFYDQKSIEVSQKIDEGVNKRKEAQKLRSEEFLSKEEFWNDDIYKEIFEEGSEIQFIR